MNILKHWPLSLFLTLYFVFALLNYKQIPIANGEEFRYLRGKETLTHLISPTFKDELIQPTPNYFLYNGYTALLVALNHHFYYEWFHLANLLFASLIFVTLYFASYFLTKNTYWAIFSVISLVLIPSFFGQLGFNPVDMPFTALYFLTILFLYIFRNEEYTARKILTLGLLIGFAQGMRQLGLGLYILIVLYDIYLKKPIFKNIGSYILLFITANFFMLITWPNFAINYFKNAYWYVFIGQNFYLWDYGLLFMGKILENSQRPAYYLPLLQTITLPIFILITTVAGLINFRKLIKHDLGFLTVSTLILNYALYFILHPVLYDGTRHFMFLVPFIVLTSIYFLSTLNFSKSKLFFVLIAIDILFIANFYIKSFPYSYIYYNPIAKIFKEPYYQFETDYSSTTYKIAAEWVRDNYVPNWDKTHTKLLKVYSCDNGYAIDYYSYKKFITVINRSEANLVMCDYRIMLKNDYKGEVVYEAKVDDIPLVLVFEPKIFMK